jgi:NADH dehydrogenase
MPCDNPREVHRMSHRILLLGGSGFVGSHLAARLVRDGHSVTVLSRQPHRHPALRVLPTLRLVAADVHDEAALTAACAQADVVINLVGILNEPGRNGLGFRRAHTELARRVVEACRRVGVARLLHMSALNADAAKGASYYLRSKGEAEGIVLTQAGPELKVTVFQPSVIFGADDALTNRFAALLELAPLLFPLACHDATLAPVWVEDVVEAMARAIDDRRTHGQRYQLCGPQALTLEQLLRFVRDQRGLRTLIWRLPRWLGKLQAALLEFVPGKPFSLDNWRSLQLPSICSNDGFAPFGIAPRALEAVAPAWLARRNQRGRYDAMRARVGRA